MKQLRSIYFLAYVLLFTVFTSQRILAQTEDVLLNDLLQSESFFINKFDSVVIIEREKFDDSSRIYFSAKYQLISKNNYSFVYNTRFDKSLNKYYHSDNCLNKIETYNQRVYGKDSTQKLTEIEYFTYDKNKRLINSKKVSALGEKEYTIERTFIYENNLKKVEIIKAFSPDNDSIYFYYDDKNRIKEIGGESKKEKYVQYKYESDANKIEISADTYGKRVAEYFLNENKLPYRMNKFEHGNYYSFTTYHYYKK